MATITTIETTDNLNQGRLKINTNFTNLNNDKLNTALTLLDWVDLNTVVATERYCANASCTNLPESWVKTKITVCLDVENPDNIIQEALTTTFNQYARISTNWWSTWGTWTATWVKLTWDQTIDWVKTFSWILKKTEAEYSITATSWTINLNYNNWTYQKVTLSWTTTFTLSNPNRNFFTLKITNWWAQTITWPSVNWAWWEAPTLTSAWTDIVSFYYDWTSYYWDYQTAFATV